MSDRTKIQWTDATWNPVRARNTKTGKVGWHCIKISPACANCYAARQNLAGFAGGTGQPYSEAGAKNVDVYLDDRVLRIPMSWKKPRKIFVCSMTDLFGDWVDDWMLDRIFSLMAICNQHTFQVLTKRPERMVRYFDNLKKAADEWAPKTVEKRFSPAQVLNCRMLGVRALPMPGGFSGQSLPLPGGLFGQAFKVPWPLPNVWIGVTAENQEMADERLPLLLETPAVHRFVSAEPLLGELNLSEYLKAAICPRCGVVIYCAVQTAKRWCSDCCVRECNEFAEGKIGQVEHHGEFEHRSAISQIIAGGETGPRPMHPNWARGLRDQCERYGASFFFKQWGDWVPYEQSAQQPFLESQNGKMIDAHRLPDLSEHEPIRGWYWPADQFAEEASAVIYRREGVKEAGRLLDGVEYSEFPEALPC